VTNPGGENEIVMFKSCYPNSNLRGSPDDPVPPIGNNPLRGEGVGGSHTVANAKGIYNDLLEYFATRQDKLFVVITAPPVQNARWADNARAFNNWLVEEWLADYAHDNVAVFDFYNVLTSNGGNWHTNDLGWATGNHHRYRNEVIEHTTDQGQNTAAYPNGGSNNHPSPAGNQKASGEFAPLLNIYYHRWKGQPGAPTGTPTPTFTPTPTTQPTATPTSLARMHLPLILKTWSGPLADVSSRDACPPHCAAAHQPCSDAGYRGIRSWPLPDSVACGPHSGR